MSRRQTLAVEARVETIPELPAFVSRADHATTPPYAVVHPSSGTDTQERFTGPRLTMHPRYTLHIVGANAGQAEIYTDRLKAQFISGGFGIPLVVSNETCENLWWSQPVPIQIDDDANPSIAYSVVEIGWTANPV